MQNNKNNNINNNNNKNKRIFANEEEINHLQEEFENTIAASKVEGKKIIEKSIEQARENATKEANKIIDDAEAKSKTISFHSDPQIIKNIIEILLSEMNR